MSQTFEFYDARANEAAAEAQDAVLANVRDRALRSEKTWRGLAEQARKVAVDRQKAEATREARRAEEAEQALIVAAEAAGGPTLAKRTDAGAFKDALGRSLPRMSRAFD